MTLLTVRNLCIAFGGITALEDVSFAVDQGEIFALIGPNGAGKTTLFNIVSGIYHADNGSIALGGEDVTGLEPNLLAEKGMSRTFQNLQIFPRMTAVENVMVGRHLKESRSFLRHLFGFSTRDNRVSRDHARRALEAVDLAGVAETRAGNLSYGAAKRLEIARALATEPRILLLDEPAAGCNPVETAEIEAVVRAISATGVTIILVEHDMKLVMRLSHRIHVLAQGRTLAEGAPDTVRSDPSVVEAYLGTHGAREAEHGRI
jgi:branched-chain amino acid transport system ATP-binding protein